MARVTTVMLVAFMTTFATAAGSEEAAPTATPTATPSASSERSLADVARETRLTEDGRTPIVIDEAALRRLADEGRLTEAAGTPTPTPPTRRSAHGGTAAGGADPSGAAAGGTTRTLAETDEGEARAYWRSLYTRQFELVESIRKEIERLDEEIPGLWRQFYAWDDPAYRDGVIKPKLDAALERREKLEQDLVAEQARLPEILEEARRSGALPGWFRDLPKPTPRSERDDRQPWGVPTVAP